MSIIEHPLFNPDDGFVALDDYRIASGNRKWRIPLARAVHRERMMGKSEVECRLAITGRQRSVKSSFGYSLRVRASSR